MLNDSRVAPGGFAPATTRADSVHAPGTLIDRHGRRITYIRLSVTDRCDFRCSYCMPMHVEFLPKREVLTLEECLRVVRAFALLGVDKVRITGGEPLVRRDLCWLLERASSVPGVRELAITTNGSQLSRMAREIRAAGVDRVNISLDTLDPEKFRRLTRVGDLPKVLAGIDAALEAGFGGVKLNTVMMRGFNDGELADLARFAVGRGMDISYIEEMPLGDVGHSRARTYLGSDEALATLREEFGLEETEITTGGPARYWRVAGTGSKVGFISPHSHNFCASCNRVRISCRGELFPCLGQNESVDLKPALRVSRDSAERLRERIAEAMEIKPKGHEFDLAEAAPKVVRFMSHTGG